MKKSITLFSLILTFVLLCGFAFAGGGPALINKKVCAKSFDGQHIVVVGKGEIEVDPDTVQVSFGLKCRGETLQEGQTKIRENIESISNKIKEYNKDAIVYTNYMSSYPVYENGLLAYEYDCCLIAKTNNVEDSNGLVDAIVNAGAKSVHSVTYLLSNKEEAYISALVEAKENAEKKVKAIYDNVTLIGLKEESVYNYCESSRGAKIKITAKVNACYEVNNGIVGTTENDSSTMKKAFETSSNSTTAQGKTNKNDALKLDNKKYNNLENKNTINSIESNKLENDITENVNANNENKEEDKKIENKKTNENNEEKNEIKTLEQVSDNNKDSKDVKIETNKEAEDISENVSSKEDDKAKETNVSNLENNKSEDDVTVNNLDSKKSNETKENNSVLNKKSNNKQNKVSKNESEKSVKTRKIVDASGNVIVEII